MTTAGYLNFKGPSAAYMAMTQTAADPVRVELGRQMARLYARLGSAAYYDWAAGLPRNVIGSDPAYLAAITAELDAICAPARLHANARSNEQ